MEHATPAGKAQRWERPVFIAALGLAVMTAIASKRTLTAPPLAAMAPQAERESRPAPDLGIADPLNESSTSPGPSASLLGEIHAVGRYTPVAGFERYYGGRPLRRAGTMRMIVTAYSPDERSCGEWADGVTASNSTVWRNGMQLVAADTSVLPFGTLLSIDDYAGGEVVPVLDRGGKIKGMRLDVLFPTHEEAMQWGVCTIDVVRWVYADE